MRPEQGVGSDRGMMERGTEGGNKVDEIKLIFPLPYTKFSLQDNLKIKELEKDLSTPDDVFQNIGITKK